LNEIDSVIDISLSSYEALRHIDDSQGAARVLCSTIFPYIERGELDKAKWAMFFSNLSLRLI
jgi:hypothetical protein